MKKTINIASFLALISVLLLTAVAATPVALTRPNIPSVVATGNAGELRVSWNSVAAAQHYTIGYANLDDLNQMSAAGRNALDAFYYVTVGSANTRHTLTGLKPETAYYVLIGARTQRFGSADLTWGSWSNAVTTAGQHGQGFCPITGLQIPASGYLSVGDTKIWSDATFSLDNAKLPLGLAFNGAAYPPNEGDKFLRLCSTWSNRTGADEYFSPGIDNNLATDAGIGFASILGHGWLDASPVPNGQTRSACDVWTIPESATTAVYAIYDANTADNAVLFRIDLSTLATTTASIPSGGSTQTDTTPISQRHIAQKEYMLELINAERSTAGVGSVTLGDNVAAQLHAESALENCFSSHWGLDGLKPYMRYSLAGGHSWNGENGLGRSYCITAADGYSANSDISQEIREAMDSWMASSGHRRNLLGPWHKKVNVGLAWDRYNATMYQHFEGDYIEFDQAPSIANSVLYVSGAVKNGVRFAENRDLGIQVFYDPPPRPLTVGQVARTYCYDLGLQVAGLRWPLSGGSFWPTDEFTTSHDPCPNPYDVAANAPAPASVNEAHEAWQEAYDASQSSIATTITVPWVTASAWASSGTNFAVRANLSNVLDRHGNGVYTVMVWGKIGTEQVPISQYSIFHGVTPPDTYNPED